MKPDLIMKRLLLSSAMLSLGATAYAQDDNFEDEIIVVGTQIKGSDIAGILPVTSLDVSDIELTGAVSGDELLASIPQLGDVAFTGTNFGGVNGARGDVGSINLRGVGEGNTLVLLNGRRVVNHPGTQAVNQTPVVSVNSNALPVTGIQRLEVLRDGASAVYGTDAVAGVVNTVLDDGYEGLQTQLQFGFSEGTSLRETSATLKWGKNFNDDRTNISLFANGLIRNGKPASDLRNSASEDLRPFFVDTPFEGDTQLRNTSVDTAFGIFRTVSGGQALGIGDNNFHIQPDTFAGCLGPELPGGVCADNSGSTTVALGDELRLDRAGFRDIVGDTDRINLFGFVNHEFENGLEFFGEASYYYADFSRRRETAQFIGSQRNLLAIPETAFFNPFGEAIFIDRLRPIDTGQREINVENDSFRILGGLRGNWNGWDWESALLHSEAETRDRTNRVSLTLFQEAISRTDATAYNPFAGGSLTDFNAPSTFNTQNNQATIDSFIVDVRRDGKTRLTLADFKVSNPSIFALPAGDIGAAAGVEWRNEFFEDDRDQRLDGTITFTDAVTGVGFGSDVIGSSPTGDTRGSRDVFSAFVELAVPVVSPDMSIPFVHSFDLQLAARAEDYSDVGGIIRPKIAASWFPIEQFQIRGAYSEGFRAPNLEQVNATEIRRVNGGREDFILCEAIARSTGTTFTNDDACDNVAVESIRSGGPDLEPETSRNFSLGATFQLSNYLTLTADWWRIEQDGLVGIFSDQNELSLDFLRRLQGSTNPNVIRAEPDPDLATLFTSVGLDPSGAGEVIGVTQLFRNLDLRESEGIDFGVQVNYDTEFGDFTFKGNAAHILTFFQDPSAEGLELLAAIDDGTLNPLVNIIGQESLLRQNGNPDWRFTASLLWNYKGWGAGAFYRFIGDVVDTSVNNDEFDALPVGSFKTLDLYVDYTFEDLESGNLFEGVRTRFGVRNIGDVKPPIADQFATGHFTGLHSNRGRYWYASVRKTF